MNDFYPINVYINALLKIQSVSNMMAMKIVDSSEACRVLFAWPVLLILTHSRATQSGRRN
jgi:hypothetical protein